MTTTPQTNVTLAEIAELIQAHDNFVLCGHVGPDGDCLGCQLALMHALRALGKQAACVLVCDEPIGAGLAFMPGIDEMLPAESYAGPCDVFVGLDVPNRERIGAAVDLLDQSCTSITIDHHAADARMCEYAYVDPDAASTSLLIWELIKLLFEEPEDPDEPDELPLECALCCYVGLVTDTGGFCYQNADERAFQVASEMVSVGVQPADVAVNVFHNRSLASLQLEAVVIENMRVLAGGQAVLSWVSLADFKRAGAVKADAETLIDTLRSLSGARVACILREQETEVRGSLRAKDNTDVSVLAREFGGGGHRAAAGLSLNPPLEQAIELMSEKLCALVETSER